MALDLHDAADVSDSDDVGIGACDVLPSWARVGPRCRAVADCKFPPNHSRMLYGSAFFADCEIQPESGGSASSQLVSISLPDRFGE